MHAISELSHRYIANELCEGTLEDYIREKYRGPNFPNKEREMLHQLTKGVAYLHGCHIVHRDIKPVNILIYVAGDDNGSMPQIKLNIPSIAKTLKGEREDFTNTSVTHPTGTMGWMAPEVYEFNRFDFKADIWSLGCVFAYALTDGGKHPFDDEDNNANIREFRIKKKENMLLTIEDLKRPHCDDHSLFELIQSIKYKTLTLIIISIFFVSNHTCIEKKWRVSELRS